MPRVALVTAAHYRALDPDLPLAVAALRGAGVTATVEVWDDPGVEWDGFDLAVVRSCWDYVPRREEFLAWAERVPRLRNTSDVLRWSTDKRYLHDLVERGVPVVPTAWDPAGPDDLPPAPSGEWVVKPAVSAGSRDTARWASPADVLRHAAELGAQGRVAMVQPYVSSVDARGETALLHLGGAFSHAVRKGPLLRRGEGVRQDRDSREDLSATEADDGERQVAAAALAGAADVLGGTPLLYARVDVVAGDDGPQLLELELAEPSLFLAQAPGAADRLAQGVLAALGAV